MCLKSTKDKKKAAAERNLQETDGDDQTDLLSPPSVHVARPPNRESINWEPENDEEPGRGQLEHKVALLEQENRILKLEAELRAEKERNGPVLVGQALEDDDSRYGSLVIKADQWL